jgi:hypothetical protein
MSVKERKKAFSITKIFLTAKKKQLKISQKLNPKLQNRTSFFSTQKKLNRY